MLGYLPIANSTMRSASARWRARCSPTPAPAGMAGMLSLECCDSRFGRLAGYEDVNDAQRLRHDPAMQWIVGGKAASDCAASPSQMGRFETKWLAAGKNLSLFPDLSGPMIDRVCCWRPARGV